MEERRTYYPKNSLTNLSSICVFCGASEGAKTIYGNKARDFGIELANRNIRLIYGGGSIGLMGIIARTVWERKCETLSIIPTSLIRKESAGDLFGKVLIVDTLLERKAAMMQHADAFIALPGGLGTVDELLEAITWGQLGIHCKPIGLLNIDRYFDPLIKFIEHQIEEGFIRPKYRSLIVVSDNPSRLLDMLDEHQPPQGIVDWPESQHTYDYMKDALMQPYSADNKHVG